ncbi:hypothetical protein [Pseudomonas syringae]|uniref:hypothetical protein n=1 Tax=Pseudomonas syringae TaxID=317 RepID=UPI0004019364|nr:hypothetical protein [Pseudomonas syringae]QGG77337.1 hypothetical protein N028_19050 [Pseudomonas syringae USA011]
MAAFFVPMNSFLVSRFEKQTLSNLVTHCFGSDFPDILQKPQVAYIFSYLKEMKAVSVLLERNYVDKDYLEDFSRYYVKRFGNAGHQCARMHFFTKPVDHRLINTILKAESGAEELALELNESYLGFMVIKPLPKTFIGKTCLKVMSDVDAPRAVDSVADAGVDSTAVESQPQVHEPDIEIGQTGQVGKRKCRLSREYKVDLFGIDLIVQSIAFQEQDKVVSACASTAIWSSLHALKWRDVRAIHSCSEITLNAINHIDGSSNSFPNKELTNKQILRCLDVEGLRHHSEDLKKQKLSEDDFLATVMGHIDSHLPLLVMGSVSKVTDEGTLEDYDAGHAVCILGYKVDSDSVVYVHDDRLGPYARAKLVKLKKYDPNASAEDWALGLQRMIEDTDQWMEPHELIVPEFLAMPTDTKARLPFFYAHYTGQKIASAFAGLVSPLAVSSTEPKIQAQTFEEITYAVKLRSISEIRQEIRTQIAPAEYLDLSTGASFQIGADDLDSWQRDKITFLTSSFARLQWEVQFFYGSVEAFRVFIDASDIPQGNAVSFIYVDNIFLSTPLLTIFATHGSYVEERAAPVHFYQSFLARLRDREETLEEYLDDTYGPLRAPIKLKEQEFLDGKISTNPTRQVLRDPQRKKLAELHGRFAEEKVIYLIWAVAHDGALLIGEEIYLEIGGVEEPCGHPSITKFRPARIAGELWKVDGGWVINPMSGRYSGDYDEAIKFMDNSLEKFRLFFPYDTFDLETLPPKSRHLASVAWNAGIKVNG